MPSKSRGLRTSTGCLTCRQRRVKCDEGRPSCQNCVRVTRECVYAERSSAPRQPRALSARKPDEGSSTGTESVPPESEPEASVSISESSLSSEAVAPIQSWIPFPTGQSVLSDNVIPDERFLLNDSVFNFGDNLITTSGPNEWYDRLAEDAINLLQERPRSIHRDFDIASLSRRQPPMQTIALESGDSLFSNMNIQSMTVPTQPWNTHTKLELNSEEMVYFSHYVTVVAPILDLFDTERHFANIVPHLALRNVGLLKSILAVGACHMSLYPDQDTGNESTSPVYPQTPVPCGSVSTPLRRKIGDQFFLETLQYISQNLIYQSYTTSLEILATGIMLSTFEMFGAGADYNHSEWDRHLRGAFWIQRNTGTSGESANGLQRAVWWAWLRQDVWAAFRTGRPALTVHQPITPMAELTLEGLTTRIIYIAAKCVQYAATPKQDDIAGYIEAGETLLRILDAWKHLLPPSFDPIPGAPASQVTSPPSLGKTQIQPIWIHPPAHAAAIQTYHFARIVVLLNQPSNGGLNTYQTRFKLLHESTSIICGIVVAEQSQNLPSAFVSFQALYAAALCAETKERQEEILKILRKVLSISMFPSVCILNDLANVWDGGSSQ
ncbi:hypothetical protein COCMIDRAFT_39900 [Bipolaris oryzae ATCC 44560]|uniref:Zn(2)-C6 fungal-type domain-containing protein n=1 Tax=Bipolaris oryzae ATCC 44560 TaxID=930090 RepID=W6ZEQ5_COCMI|nr:uncharacterized protein COCMIDRAFT_39900 [Bipolaris oryzae ATCC 44560]EUC42006.1 hypothetical protein COCMIDRAFT_39900 [Bipolaris oryzae ATCC 44560]